MKIHARSRTLILKIVYFGPGMSGKTTNLVRLHEGVSAEQRGELIRLDTEAERTLFFDYFPFSLGHLGAFRIRLHFFTVPGQSFYSETRRAVLKGADGVVFVADSSPRREHANQLALKDMDAMLESLGLSHVPRVFQWNKRDLHDALPLPLMERTLNPDKHASTPASASRGEGVQFTQALITRAVIEGLRANPLLSGDAERTQRLAGEP